MNTIARILLLISTGVAMSACSSVPKYEKISSKYTSCDANALKPVEITNHGWYRSWYVDCKGQEYFCRYSASNENGWNGCHATNQSADVD